jgi:hypothetical protein
MRNIHCQKFNDSLFHDDLFDSFIATWIRLLIWQIITMHKYHDLDFEFLLGVCTAGYGSLMTPKVSSMGFPPFYSYNKGLPLPLRTFISMDF